METSKFRPILFSTPMVQALLEGRKTMTRRTKGLEEVNKNPDDWKSHNVSTDETRTFFHFRKMDGEKTKQIFGTSNIKVGDVLWVRETFELVPVETSSVYNSNSVVENKIQYKADGVNSFNKWKPSIFMPKQACRIFLKIKAIRVERLRDISREDARSEGIERDLASGTKFKNYMDKSTTYNEKTSFYSLWESINGKQSFEYNPFVFVYEFEQIEKPLNFNV